MAAASIEPTAEIAGVGVRDRYRAAGNIWPAVRRHASDFVASLTGAAAAVPSGMAASVIVGVSPIHGLYASIVGPVLGGMTARTGLLIVTTTSASAFAAGEVVRASDGAARVQSLLLLTLIAGLFQLAASAAGLARYAGYVSHSVLTGFLMGVGTLIVLGQLGSLAGYAPVGDSPLARTADLGRHYADVDYATLGVSLSTLLILGLTRLFGLKVLGPIVALAIPSLVVGFAGLTSVATVGDSGAVPSGLPMPALPDSGLLNASILWGALALAAIVFVQTSGASQILPTRQTDDRQERDLVASGVANVGASLFGGQPVGGSLGQSTLNQRSGARTRLAAMLSGVWILAFVLAFGDIIEGVAMPSLSALLIVVGLGAINFAEGTSVWQAGWGPRATVLLTFAATLYLPLQLAVAFAALLCVVLYLVSAAPDVRVVELVRLPQGGLKAQKPPERLSSHAVTILQVEGSLFYAGARTLERKLPGLPGLRDTRRPVAVLRIRGRTKAGTTLIDVLSSYAARLREHDGRLYITGVGDEMRTRFEASGRLSLTGTQVTGAKPVRRNTPGSPDGASSRWLVESRDFA